MTITVVFDPPLPSDSPATFNTKAFATLGDLNDWSTEANALAADVTSKQGTASTAATTATTQAGIATTQAGNASTSAGTATTQAGIATTQAGIATAAAASVSAIEVTTHAANPKVTPADDDEIPLADSAATFGLKKLTWANIKATLATWIGGGTIAGSFTTLASSGNTTLGDASTDTLNIGNGGIYKDASGRTGVNTIAPRSILHVELPNTANAFALVRTGVAGGGSGGTAFTATDTIPIISGTGFAGYGGLAIIPNRWGNATTADYHTALYMAGGQRNNGASVTNIAFANWGYFTGTGIAAGELGEGTARNDAVSFSIAHLDGGSQFVQTLRIKGRTATGVTSSLLSINTTGTVLAHGAGGLGYGTGAGGTVTQATSRTTGVTLSKPTGAITLFSASGSATARTFTVTNTLVADTDVIKVAQKSGTDKYIIAVTNVAAGSFQITSYTTGGTSVEQPVFVFAVIKGATA